MSEIGSLVYYDGNKAGIVIGHDDAGGLIIGTFAGAVSVEKGDFGGVPSAAAENPPSFVPSTGSPSAPSAPAPAVTAGDLETAEPVRANTPSDGETVPGDNTVTDLNTPSKYVPEPQDNASKLRSLLEAGLIDQSTYDAAIEKA